MPNHTVAKGECIASIAFDFGHFPDTIWNAPENGGLRELRKDPNVLIEGDEVFVPEKRIKRTEAQTDARHRFKRKGVPEKLMIRFVDALGKPRPGIEYRLEIDKKSITTGLTDSDGWLREAIPPNAMEGLLILGRTEEYNLQLGVLDPVDSITGLQDRLVNLGYSCGDDPRGTMGEGTGIAIRQFRADQGLEPFNELDDATLQDTRNRLEQRHRI